MEVVSYILSFVPTWVFWILVIGIALFWYLRNKWSYWKRAGVPYALFVPFSKSARELHKKPQHEMDLKLYKEHGRIFGYYEGTRPSLTLAEPDIMKDIFVKDFQFFPSRRRINAGDQVIDTMLANLHGKNWKRVRTIISPAFSTGKIKKMTSIFIDSAKTLTDSFRTAVKDGKSVDMERLFGAFTMDVIASCAFGTKIDSHNDPENPFVTAGKSFFTQSSTWHLIMHILFPAFSRFVKIGLFNSSAVNFFEKAAIEIVEERKRSKQDAFRNLPDFIIRLLKNKRLRTIFIRRNDLLQLMIDAVENGVIEDEEEEEGSSFVDGTERKARTEGSEKMSKQQMDLKSLSNAELVSQCFGFFIAGYSPVMLTLTFTAYELALNPDIQDNLIEEIDGAIREKGELDYEAVSKMKYLDNVVSETLRKYPAAIRIERQAAEDYYIEEHNLTIPKGMIVGFPVYAIHHDPEYYPDPEKYDPDRFTQEEKSTRHPYTYIPFGAGPRNCVATRFALMEVKVCLAYVLSQFRFSKCDETQIPLEFIKNYLAMQPKKVTLKLEIRSDNVKI